MLTAPRPPPKNSEVGLGERRLAIAINGGVSDATEPTDPVLHFYACPTGKEKPTARKLWAFLPNSHNLLFLRARKHDLSRNMLAGHLLITLQVDHDTVRPYERPIIAQAISCQFDLHHVICCRGIQ